MCFSAYEYSNVKFASAQPQASQQYHGLCAPATLIATLCAHIYAPRAVSVSFSQSAVHDHHANSLTTCHNSRHRRQRIRRLLGRPCPARERVHRPRCSPYEGESGRALESNKLKASFARTRVRLFSDPRHRCGKHHALRLLREHTLKKRFPFDAGRCYRPVS